MALLLPVREGVLRLEPGEQQSLDSLLQVLRSEAAPVSTWMYTGQHLLAAGRDSDYETLMSEAVDRQALGSDNFSHVLALCSLAEFTAQRAAAERDRRSRALLLSRCTELCLRAQRLSGGSQEQLPELVLANAALIKVGAACAFCKQSIGFAGRSHVCSGFCNILCVHPAASHIIAVLAACLQGDTAAAKKGFDNAARMRCNGRPSIAAQLGLANLHFNQHNYVEALRL